MIITLILLAGGAISCPKTEIPVGQIVEIKRGNLIVTVKVDGNLSMPRQAKLAFDTIGTIQEIKVREGDKVTKGQLLAKLDTSSLELALKVAENDLEIAKTNLEIAKYKLRQTAELIPLTHELAIKLAKIDLEIAEYKLMETAGLSPPGWKKVRPDYTTIYGTDIPGTRGLLKEIDDLLAKVKELLAAGKISQAQSQLQLIEEKLTKAQYKLGGKLFYYPLSVKLADLKLDKAGIALDKAKIELQKAFISVKLAKLEVDRARIALNKAKIALDKAKIELQKAFIFAPYDGIVADIGAKEGDKLSAFNYATTIVVHLIDPNLIELKAFVDEIDVPKVKSGREAIITVDALPDVELKGKVVFVSPVATIRAGVVSYEATLNLKHPGNIELKDGMTATGKIIIDRRENVLLVPNRAIKGTPGNYWVKTIKNGIIESRAVTLGISDGKNTEVLSGLSEGEKVIIEAPSP